MLEFSPMRRVALFGVNLWLVALVIPLAYARAGWVWALAPAAPAALALGIWRRLDAALVLGVPIATLLPLALPELEGARQSPLGFAAACAALVGYEIFALRALDRGDGAAAASRALAEVPEPRRWARRLRVQRGLTAAAVLLPALLAYAVCLHPPTAARVQAAFPGQAERALAMLTAFAALVSALVAGVWLVRPLAAHLERDLAVQVLLERSRRVARRGRPRPAFYLAVAVALALMVAVIALKAGG